MPHRNEINRDSKYILHYKWEKEQHEVYVLFIHEAVTETEQPIQWQITKMSKIVSAAKSLPISTMCQNDEVTITTSNCKKRICNKFIAVKLMIICESKWAAIDLILHHNIKLLLPYAQIICGINLCWHLLFYLSPLSHSHMHFISNHVCISCIWAKTKNTEHHNNAINVQHFWIIKSMRCNDLWWYVRATDSN